MNNKDLQSPITRRELLQTGSGQMIATIGGLLGVRILTRLMPPEIYGELALGMTFFFLVQQTLMGPVNNGFARYYPLAGEKSGIPEYLNAVFQILFKAGILTLLLFMTTSLVLLLTGNSTWITLIFFTFLFTLFSGFNLSMDSIQNGARNRLVVAWHQALAQWLRFLMAAAGIIILGATSGNAMAGFCFASVLVSASQYVFLKRKIPAGKGETVQRSEDRAVQWWKLKILRFSIPFSSWGIFSFLLISSDRWALLAFGSTHSVGLYAVLYQLGYYPVTILTGIAVQLVSPVLYSIAGDGKNAHRTLRAGIATHRMVLVSLVFTLAAVAVSWLLSRWLFSILVSSQYRHVHSLLPLMVLSGGIFASGQICSLTALNNHRPRILIAPKISTSLFGTGLNFAGAAILGVKGVVIGGVIFSVTYFLWVYILVNRGWDPEKVERE